MSTTGTSSTKCSNCGAELPNREEVRTPCPYCGSKVRTFTENVHEFLHTSEIVSWEHIREFYEKNPGIRMLVIILTILTIFVGSIFKGIFGFAVGIYLGIAIYLLSPDAVTKVREITKG